MKTGDSFQDAQGGAWQLGQLLGRGLWGKTYAVRRESDDTVFVLKSPLGPEDFKGEVGGADAMFAACREAALEQARIYGDARHPFLPRLEARVALPNGSPGYILPKLPDSLERRIHEGLPTAGLLDAALAVLRLVRQLPNGWHGAIRPSNVLFNERGEVFLTDVATPAVLRTLGLLLAANPGQAPSYPPEVVDAPDRWGPQVDTWSVAMWLWRGAMAGAPAPNPPRAGLDKAGQVALRDRIQDRLKSEDANPRFHSRVAERYAVLLARALSREASPSPPFRFPSIEEFAGRVEEVGNLIRPQVTSVGKVLLDRPASKPFFDTDEAVAFSCTVACTSGVEGPEEIGVGIAVFDIDRDERLKDLELAYTVDKHPGSGPAGGRYRFGFRITGLAPGRFRARLAFAIRDSGQAPATSESEFNVLPAPGWVPKAEPTAAVRPLTFSREVDDHPTRPGAAPPAPMPPSPGQPAAAALPPEGPVTVTGVTMNSGGRRIPIPVPAGPAPAASTTVSSPRPVAPPARPPLASPGPSPAPRGDAAPARPERPGPIVRAASAGEASPIASPSVPTPADARPPDARSAEPPRAAIDPKVTTVARPVSLPASPRADLPTVPIPAAPPPAAPAPVVLEEDEPAWTPRHAWTDEPLPSPARAAPTPDVFEDEELDAEPAEPNLVSRVVEQLRTDPYLAVMAGLGAITLVLLIVFLLIRQ